MRRLPIGRAWETLREDEIACRSLGINTVNSKLTAFATGAMFRGFASSFLPRGKGSFLPRVSPLLKALSFWPSSCLAGLAGLAVRLAW